MKVIVDFKLKSNNCLNRFFLFRLPQIHHRLQHHQPHPLGQLQTPPVDQSLHDQSFNITMEIAEPEPVVERYVTISSIISINIENVKKPKTYLCSDTIINQFTVNI